MTLVRILAVAVTLGMAAAIAFGAVSGGFGSDASLIWSLAWGKVTVIDLYLGLAVFGGWVFLREKGAGRVALWWLALLVLGNLAAGIYLVMVSFKSKDIQELLTGQRD